MSESSSVSFVSCGESRINPARNPHEVRFHSLNNERISRVPIPGRVTSLVQVSSSTVAIGRRTGQISFVSDPSTGTCGVSSRLRGHFTDVTSLALVKVHDGSEHLASASTDQTVRLWNVSNLSSSSSRVLEGHSGSVSCVDYVLDRSPDWLVDASLDATCFVWNLEREEVIGTPLRSRAFSQRGKSSLCHSLEHSLEFVGSYVAPLVSVYDWRTWTLVGEMDVPRKGRKYGSRGGGGHHCVSFVNSIGGGGGSGSGHRLVVSNSPGCVFVYDIRLGFDMKKAMVKMYSTGELRIVHGSCIFREPRLADLILTYGQSLLQCHEVIGNSMKKLWCQRAPRLENVSIFGRPPFSSAAIAFVADFERVGGGETMMVEDEVERMEYLVGIFSNEMFVVMRTRVQWAQGVVGDSFVLVFRWML